MKHLHTCECDAPGFITIIRYDKFSSCQPNYFSSYYIGCVVLNYAHYIAGVNERSPVLTVK